MSANTFRNTILQIATDLWNSTTSSTTAYIQVCGIRTREHLNQAAYLGALAATSDPDKAHSATGNYYVIDITNNADQQHDRIGRNIIQARNIAGTNKPPSLPSRLRNQIHSYKALWWLVYNMMYGHYVKPTFWGKKRWVKWVLGSAHEHCATCRTANGQVHDIRAWNQYGVYPRGRGLLCHGVNCKCQFYHATKGPVGNIYNIPYDPLTRIILPPRYGALPKPDMYD